jgi:uncharacterized membrane protein
MGDNYSFNIPKIIIHVAHILIGLWLVYIGYKKITNNSIDDMNYKLLWIMGIILLVYFIIVIYKNIGKYWNYAFGIPNWMIFTTHIINALLFIAIGFKYIDISTMLSLYLVVSGSLAGLYHTHLMFVNH